MSDLVKIKGLKGKQNKKKWAKNIDVSALIQSKAKQHDEEIRKQFLKPLIVEDTTQTKRQPLDPNRFKNRVRDLPKKVYNNKIQRPNNFNDIEDIWENSDQPASHTRKIADNNHIPSVILPPSGHSYHPRQQDVNKIVDQIIDYEAKKQIIYKEKVLKEDKIVVPRSRNKKKRRHYLQKIEKEQAKEAKQQLHNIRRLRIEEEQRQTEILKKIKTRKIKKEGLRKQEQTGKVRQGKRIGKVKYHFKQFLPTSDEIGKKISHLPKTDDLVRERYDSIFRRGIFEPRTIKVHHNRRKHIKVKQRFNE